jgi:hypothetical protein
MCGGTVRGDITALRSDATRTGPKALATGTTTCGMDRRSFLLGLGATAAVAGAEQALLVHRLTLDAETFDFGLRCNDLGPRIGEFTDRTELEPRERRVLEAAVDGGYRTDTTPAWLRRFVHGTGYVRVDDRFYELDATLPTFVVEPEAVDPQTADGPVASAERYRAVRETENGVTCALTCETADGGYRTTRTVWLRPETRSFLREFDYVEHHGAVVRLPVRVEDPGPPYRVTAHPVPAAVVRSGETLVLDDVSPETRDDPRRAIRTPGAAGIDGLSRGAVEMLRRHAYLRADGRYYTTYLSDVGGVPLEARGRTRRDEAAPFDPARLELGVRNVGDGPIEVDGGPPIPFGLVSAHPPGVSDRGRPVWSPAYRGTDAITTVGRRPIAALGIGATATVAPGETLSILYEFGPLRPGTWVADESVGVTVDGDSVGAVPIQFTLTCD